jgi:nucleotidyltransferase/DNA polymerase involved in DNA repair
MTAPEKFAQQKSFPAACAHCADEKNGANWAQLQLDSTPMPDDPGQPTLGKHGGKRTKGQQGDNVTLRSRGNSVAYIVSRLRREGLHERVEAIRKGEISAFAVAVLLGWKRRTTVHDGDRNRSRRFDARAMIG